LESHSSLKRMYNNQIQSVHPYIYRNDLNSVEIFD
jgi:hypothetical protein